MEYILYSLGQDPYVRHQSLTEMPSVKEFQEHVPETFDLSLR